MSAPRRRFVAALLAALPLALLPASRAVEPEAAPAATTAPGFNFILTTPAPAATTTPLPAPTSAPRPPPVPTPEPPVAPPPRPAPAPAAAAGKNPLGATPQEIARLYGPVLKHNARVRNHQVLEGGTVLDGDLHGRNGLVVRAVYHEGRTVLLEYTRVQGALSLADVNLLLAPAAADSTWVPGRDSTDASKYYRRADNRAVASYVTANDGSLIVAAEGADHDPLLDNLLR